MRTNLKQRRVISDALLRAGCSAIVTEVEHGVMDEISDDALRVEFCFGASVHSRDEIQDLIKRLFMHVDVQCVKQGRYGLIAYLRCYETSAAKLTAF